MRPLCSILFYRLSRRQKYLSLCYERFFGCFHHFDIGSIFVVDRVDGVEKRVGFVGREGEFYLIAIGGKVCGHREFNGYVCFAKTFNLCRLIGTGIEHHGIAVVKQLQA